MPEALWLPADSPHIDVLLVVNGCQVDCATRPTPAFFTVVIAGETVDTVPYPSFEQVNVVIKKLKSRD